MYEVQTVTIEMGPEKLIRENGKGVWQEITLSESLQVQQKYHNVIYDRVDIDIIEYETETETDAAVTKIPLESNLASETASLSRVFFETDLADEIYESHVANSAPKPVKKKSILSLKSGYENLVNEDDEEVIYDDVAAVTSAKDARRNSMGDFAPGENVDEGIYEDVTLVTSAQDAQKDKMKLGAEKNDNICDDVIPEKTPGDKRRMDDIFSQDNKICTENEFQKGRNSEEWLNFFENRKNQKLSPSRTTRYPGKHVKTREMKCTLP